MSAVETAERLEPAERPQTLPGCALITGASRGIGAATARALAAEGYAVAVNYRADRDGAEGVVEQVESAGGTAVAIAADVAEPAAAEILFDRVEDELGAVAVLVNNAGVTADGLAMRLSDADWERVLATNLDGSFRMARRALSGMVRARYGRIVNIASVVGHRANPGQANYAAAKAGLIAMTKTMAVEVARRGVTVNAVAPGLIETAMTDGVGEGLRKVIPARRAGRPEEVAACVRFLASAEASYVNGAVLAVDGAMGA